MDQATALTVIETILRFMLGLRFLYSGLSNVRRWPNAVDNARLVFPFGATFFGFVAVLLMVAGGVGLALGFQTRIAALMIVLFLIPTLKIQRYWLRTLPATIEEVNRALAQDEFSKFRLIARHALHSHETGWQNKSYSAIRGLAIFNPWVDRLRIGQLLNQEDANDMLVRN